MPVSLRKHKIQVSIREQHLSLVTFVVKELG